MPAYSVCGLRLAADARLPGLAPFEGDGPPDIVVRLQAAVPWIDDAAPIYRSADADDAGRPLLVVHGLHGGRAFGFHYVDGVRFVVEADGGRIWATWPEPWDVPYVATYLLGPVLAFALRRRGMTCLHASAVVVDDHAVIFAGPAGAGKSTIAATFAGRGHAVLADDIVALGDADEALMVQPGPCGVRLWPESVRALYGRADALPRLTPGWDKRFLDLTGPGSRFADWPRPLGAIYVLDRSAPAGTARVRPLSATDALIALVANTQANHLLDARMRGREFHDLARLAAAVGVRRLSVPDDLADLGMVYDVVGDDVLARATRV